MRNTETYLGSLLWVAAATLLPMAALEPVPALAPQPATIAAAAACADGSDHLVLGCTGASL